MELAQKSDFAVELTQAEFTRQLKFMDTSPALRKRRQNSLSDEEKLLCQGKMGELCWLATVSRPDICARLAQLASKVNDLQGSDIYRINALIVTVKIDQNRLRHFPPSPVALMPEVHIAPGGRKRMGAPCL